MKNKNVSLFDFINGKSFSQIKEELSQPPFNIIIKEKDNLYLLKYNQFDSEFDYNLVQQCRGIILEKDTNKVLCYPFLKFFNYGEKLAENINWNNASVLQKIDGSIMKIWYHNNWNLSTNGTIDAKEAIITDLLTDKEYTFYDLFIDALKANNLTFEQLTNNLNVDYTYMFELVHPISRVVILYNPDLYLIGIRNNKTLNEIDIYNKKNKIIQNIIKLNIKRPKKYSLSNIEEVIKMANELPENEEGYVVVDDKFKRIKIKSPKYLALHKLASNRDFSRRRLIEFIINGIEDDVIANFSEVEPRIKEIKEQINNYVHNLQEEMKILFQKEYNNKKEFASVAIKTSNSAVAFLIYDKRVNILDIKYYIFTLNSKKIEELLDKIKNI